MSSDLVFEAGALRRKLVVKRNARARSTRLRVDPRDGRVVMTLPRRANLKRALGWAHRQRGWVEAELARLGDPIAIVPGAELPYRGRQISIDWDEARPRKATLVAGRLVVGGPEPALEARVLRWLREMARTVLTEASQRYADKAGVELGPISVGDARSRWGSCSSAGAIRYNWRLIMAPCDVLEATAAHEVAHRVHMNHSPAFHALVAELFGRDPAPERAWLRTHGTALYRVGCSS